VRIIRWGGEEGFTGRAAIGYDHGYDAEVLYLGLALDERNARGTTDRFIASDRDLQAGAMRR
jgi:hypothetical protein